MKKHAYFSLIFLIILSMGYFSCSEDPLYQNEHFFQNLPEKSKFTVSEARAFFEAQQKQLPTRSALHKRSGRFDPGIFAPRWEEAKESANRQEGSVDVPIYSSWRYQAGRKEIRKGKKRTYWVTVSQKLVVVKDWNTNKNAMYILNIIPDKNYSKKNKGDISGRFTNSGSRKDFCGLFVYTDLKGGLPVCVTRYKSGEPTDGVYLFNKNHGLKPTLEKLNAMLKGIRLRYGAPLTRANSEDDDDYWNDEDDEDNEGNKEEGDDDWLFPDGDSYTDEDGNTCWDFEDKNGNQYTAVDWDGDGMPDSIMGDTSSITPDSGGDFDFGGWLNDFWGGFDPGNNENNEDDYDDDNNILPPYINPDQGNTNTGNNTHNGNNNSGLSPDIEIPFGKDYYKQRIQDFRKRYPTKTPPPYYSHYAEFYMNEFTERTRPLLSAQGQRWVDKTLLLLQKHMNKILENNTTIEIFPKQLEEAAFNSHVDAYCDGGLLTLSMTDKMIIFTTVYPEDLFTPLGIKQVKEVMKRQITYYCEHPLFAYEQYQEFVSHYPEYLVMLEDYAHNKRRYKTRSGSDISTIEVYNVILEDLTTFFENSYNVHFDRPQ